ncbi:MAG TPA: glutamate-1-semialdehyde 2,1-aminomutase [Armatimonadota bacterium]|nr:glutamate-1-semialdehyde 2,1-aminomutase [Armatimonadota bacterium]
MDTAKSSELFEEAQRYIPGGVNSPVRAFKAVGGGPLFIDRGRGSHIWDADGNKFIDYVGSWGPLILGHAHPLVVRAIEKAAARGTSFGATTEAEIELAKMIVDAVASVEMVRLVSSGTEAVMSAIRLARGYTGRDKIVKFEGGYHGHSDALLAKAGSGVATFGIPDSAGVPATMTADTLVLPYNDIDAVRTLFKAMGPEIACVVIEPVAGNMGVVIPKPGYLADLRELTHKYGIVLIFDEVITGFRLSYGGAQKLYGVIPDMTTLGKIIGGGLPLGAYGGRCEIMEQVAPVGPVYQAGTLSGNPVAVAAGIETLRILRDRNPYAGLEAKTARLGDALASAAETSGIDLEVNQIGSMMTAFFTREAVDDYATAKTSDTRKYAAFFRAMLEQGIYLAPSQFEAAFVSTAHTDEDIYHTVEAAEKALALIV